jgi:hypothetical protein
MDSNGKAHFALALVTILRETVVVPSEAPPVRTIVVSVVIVPVWS